MDAWRDSPPPGRNRPKIGEMASTPPPLPRPEGVKPFVLDRAEHRTLSVPRACCIASLLIMVATAIAAVIFAAILGIWYHRLLVAEMQPQNTPPETTNPRSEWFREHGPLPAWSPVFQWHCEPKTMEYEMMPSGPFTIKSHSWRVSWFCVPSGNPRSEDGLPPDFQINLEQQRSDGTWGVKTILVAEHGFQGTIETWKENPAWLAYLKPGTYRLAVPAEQMKSWDVTVEEDMNPPYLRKK
jgi:hypothetical protein